MTRVITDALNYVKRRVAEGRPFTFRQWGSDIELQVLAELGAEAIDYVAATGSKGHRQVIRLGGTLWFQEGDDNVFSWEPVKDVWQRRLSPPFHIHTYDLKHGALGRLVFEKNGRFIWLAQNQAYDGRVADWSKLSGELVEWYEADASGTMNESIRAKMAPPLPPRSALQRMTKAEILEYAREIEAHMESQFTLSMEQTKDEMIQTLTNGG